MGNLNTIFKQYSIKFKSKLNQLLAPLVFFIAFPLMSQDSFTWKNAPADNNWANAANWTKSGSNGADTYPGQTRSTDVAKVQNGGTPTIQSGSYTVNRLILDNTSGATSGSTLTINSGATLTVNGNGSTTALACVLMEGGNIVNNGTLNIIATATGTGYGIICSTPVVLPGSATEYTYSGTGALSIDCTASTGSGGIYGGAILFSGTNANTTYKLSLSSSNTSFTLAGGAYALTIQDKTISPVIISGTGFALGNSTTGVNYGLIMENAYTAGDIPSFTIDAGTTLAHYHSSTNTTASILIQVTEAGALFTNNGTINVYGENVVSGTNSAGNPIALTNNCVNSGSPATLSFTNNGTINSSLNSANEWNGSIHITSVAGNYGTVNLLNTGTMDLINSSTTANCGYSIYTNTNPPTFNITNSGTFTLNSILQGTGALTGKSTINNSGTFTINQPLYLFTFNNNNGGVLDCANTYLNGSETFTAAAGSTLKTSIAGGVNSAIICTGKTFDPAASYVFYGTASQNSGTLLTAAKDITISNTTSLKLGQNIAVSGTFSVASNAVLDGNFYVISGTGNFTLAAGATLKTPKVGGLNTTITTVGAITLNSAANYVFYATSGTQVTGALLTTCNNMEINSTWSTPTVTLSGNTTVNGNLVLTAGTLSTGANTFTLKGSTSGSGTIDSGAAGAISYDGSSTQSISNLASNTVRNLIINNSAGVSLATTSTVASDLTVNSGAKFVVSNPLTVNGNMVLNVSKTTAPSLVLTNGIAVSGTVTLRKTLDKQIWYFCSFPIDVAVNNITKFSGTSALTLNGNMWVKYYDGKGRAANLGVSTNWVSVTAGQTLLANKGYILGLADALDAGDYVLSIPLANSIVASAEGTRGVSVGIYGKDTISAGHAAWNLVGIPYMSNFTGSGVGANYISVFNGSTYDQYAKAALSTIQPYSSFFIQASTTNLTFDLASRQTVKSAVATNLAEQVQINLNSETGTDFTTLIIDERQSPAYEINQDLTKWLTLGTSRPQLYTVLGGMNYAYNALPKENVSDLPLGVYTKTAGTSIISADVSQAPGLTQLLLTDKATGTVTDLLVSDYSFTATAGTSNDRFLLSANKDLQTFDNYKQENGDPIVLTKIGKLIVKDVLDHTVIRVYDMMGKMVENVVSNANYMEIPIPLKGVYCVQLQSNGKCWNRKISL